MNKIPKVEDFFPTEGLSYDITSPQTKRFYGKVKKVGAVWVTPDGMAFPKQHLAYKSVHESYMGKEQLEPLSIPDGITLE